MKPLCLDGDLPQFAARRDGGEDGEWSSPLLGTAIAVTVVVAFWAGLAWLVWWLS